MIAQLIADDVRSLFCPPFKNGFAHQRVTLPIKPCANLNVPVHLGACSLTRLQLYLHAVDDPSGRVSPLETESGIAVINDENRRIRGRNLEQAPLVVEPPGPRKIKLFHAGLGLHLLPFCRTTHEEAKSSPPGPPVFAGTRGAYPFRVWTSGLKVRSRLPDRSAFRVCNL